MAYECQLRDYFLFNIYILISLLMMNNKEI